jgi:hypothetical protein
LELSNVKGRGWGIIGAVLSAGFAAACAGQEQGYGDYEVDEARAEASYGAAGQALAACAGDDLQYDFNAFSASLAVAIANELSRWDVATDLVIQGDRLALSNTGLSMCRNGCANVKAILALQDESSAGIPSHDPAIFRGRLTTWYRAEMAKLTELAAAARLAPGTYRLRNRAGAPNPKSTAALERSTPGQSSAPSSGSGDWIASVHGSKHKFKAAAGPGCLARRHSPSAGTALVQEICSDSPAQDFDVVQLDGGYLGFQLGLSSDGAAPGTEEWILQSEHGQGNPARVVFTGMYVIAARHSGKVLAVSDSEEDSLVTQQSYSENDDLHHWYVYPVDERYQLVNRHSGKCMALLTDSAQAPLAQKTCRAEDSQLFRLDGIHGVQAFSLTSRYHRPLEVDGARSDDGAKIRQVSGNLQLNRQFIMTPIMGAEPHRLSFSHATQDGPCGDYYWYDVTRPNGAPLINPDQMYVHLIFAGGKTRPDGADENPFIAQVIDGSKVAIDPSGYMTGGGAGTSGSCVQADILYDSSRTSAGKCCIKFDGTSATFAVTTWSNTTFLCM